MAGRSQPPFGTEAGRRCCISSEGNGGPSCLRAPVRLATDFAQSFTRTMAVWLWGAELGGSQTVSPLHLVTVSRAGEGPEGSGRAHEQQQGQQRPKPVPGHVSPTIDGGTANLQADSCAVGCGKISRATSTDTPAASCQCPVRRQPPRTGEEARGRDCHAPAESGRQAPSFSEDPGHGGLPRTGCQEADAGRRSGHPGPAGSRCNRRRCCGWRKPPPQ